MSSGPAEKAYQLVALARTDLRRAGEELTKLPAKASGAIPQLRVKLRYFAAVGDRRRPQRASRALTEQMASVGKRLARFAESAYAEKDTALAVTLWRRSREYAPKLAEVKRLQRRLPKVVGHEKR